jgi:hypothetical protein
MMTRFMQSRAVTGVWVVFVLLTLQRICLAQTPGKSYPQLRREALESRKNYEGSPMGMMSRLGFIVYPPPAPFFIPALAFRDKTSVPYLIGVLQNGEHWSDVRQLLQAYYDQQARCYAALSLGYLGDHRAYTPLVEALASPPNTDAAATGLCGKYDVRYCAAYGLANLGDPNAIDPLVKAVKGNDGDVAKSNYIQAIGNFRDMRAFEPLLSFAIERGVGFTELEYLLHAEYFRDFVEYKDGTCSYSCFPELGRKRYNEITQAFWQHWLNGGGQKLAKEEFDKFYKEIKGLNPEERWRADISNQASILALPYIIEKIEGGEEGLDFEYILSRLTTPGMQWDEKVGRMVYKPNPNKELFTSRTKTLNWWKANKAKWTIDIDQLRNKIQGSKSAEVPQATAQTGDPNASK